MSISKGIKEYLSNNCDIDLKDKIVLVTGANSGIGYKTCEIMLYLGASVIMACRNKDKAQKAKEDLLFEYPSSSIEIMQLDLSSFKSIDCFVSNLKDVDVFVNNAGLFHYPNVKSVDGFDLVMQTNYLGVYYLTEKLIPKLKELKHDVYYINTISLIHKIGRVNYKKFNNGRFAYSRSKLCLARYSNYLAEKLKNTNILVYMCHPGLAATNIATNWSKNAYGIFAKIIPLNSIEKSSLAVPFILSHELKVGSIVGPNKIFGAFGYPEINKQNRNACKDIDKTVNFTIKILENMIL